MAMNKIHSGVLGLVAVAAAFALPSSAHAQLFKLCLSDPDLMPTEQWWGAWSLAPEVVLPLAVIGYGAARLWVAEWRAGHAPQHARAATFVLGYALLVAALVSPLCRFAAILASAHMVQHLVIVAAASPLLVLGLPARHLERRLLPLWLAAGIYGAAIWIWHIPQFYTLALLSVPAHLIMYATLLGAGVVFWHAIVVSSASGKGAAAATLMLLVTLIHTGLLGALLSFSQHAWYPVMAPGAAQWGWSSLDDQRLAGMIMWVPMGAIYLIAALAVVARALQYAGQPRQIALDRDSAPIAPA